MATKIMRLFLFYAALIAMLAPFDPSYAQTQLEMNQQADREFLKADRRLTGIYSTLMTKLSPAGQVSLQKAEETWREFRDQECAFETIGAVGGSIHPMVVNLCKSRLTDQRIKALEDQLNCHEGDLSCGGQYVIFTAAAHAQRAIDYLRGLQR